MRPILIFLLFAFLVSIEGYLIESDAEDIIKDVIRGRKILSNNQTNSNNSFPIQTPAPPPQNYGTVINSIIPKIGVGGMKIRIYSDFLNKDDLYFLSFCNQTNMLMCENQCNYLEYEIPDYPQGVCVVHLDKNKLNFTYTIATKQIEMRISININLNNQSELNIFKNNFKNSLVQSLDVVESIDQVYICDTCISEVSSRRLQNIQVKIIFQIVASQPVTENINSWQEQITTETIQASSLIVTNLATLQEQTIEFLGITSGNITNTSSNINKNSLPPPPKEEDGFGKAWEIALISITSYLFIALLVRFGLYLRDKRRRNVYVQTIQKNNENKMEVDETIDEEEIIVYEI